MSNDYQRFFKWVYSFRFLIAIQAFFCTLIFLIFNRWVSQTMVWEIIHDKIQSQLASRYETEFDVLRPLELHSLPLISKDTSNLIRFDYQQVFIDQVVERSFHCDSRGLVALGLGAGIDQYREAAKKFCDELIPKASSYQSWKSLKLGDVKSFVESGSLTLQGLDWMVIKLTPSQKDAPVSWVAAPKSAVDDYVELIWDIRDRVLLAVLPIFLVTVLVTTLLITRTVINPLEKLKHRLFQLETKDLDKPLHAQSRFNEFKDFVDVFNLLRERLRASFFQAGRFSADASHELRTPLTILRGYAERAISDCEEGSRQQIRLSQMSDEIDRLISITDKLLLLSKADAGSLTLSASQVNISDMLGELVMDANMFQDKLKVTANIQKSMFWYCDAQLIQQLLHNLYTNAVNYNIEHGWIHFEARMDHAELVLVFSNPTPKMSHDLVERAFERFYRGIDSHTRLIDGHGLGLSLCKEIARVHYAELEMVEDDQNVVKVTLRVDPKALMHIDDAPVAHLLESA